MKDVIVVCEAGITTSLLVSKLAQLAEENKKEVNILSKSTEEGLEYVKDYDPAVILLGPQVHHKSESYHKETNAKVLHISVNDYNAMNVYSIFEQLMEALP